MASFLKLKQSNVWVSMLMGYFDKGLRFFRVLVAVIGVYFYLIIETGKQEAIVIEFDSEEEAKEWVEKNMLKNNLLEAVPFWTHFYSPYAAWLMEEFNINGSHFIRKRMALPSVKQVNPDQKPKDLLEEFGKWPCHISVRPADM
ncbi:MAG: hypothetical protein JSV88_15625 [Candidatus Aminicenantes bacterium]|nr:MAG: hypothetical protein JSV88_15625 [Candidatus Aminicenantes bacterium]